jgi:hypothetical protein
VNVPTYPIEFRDAASPAALEGWEGPVQGYPNRIPPWTPADFAPWLTAGVMRTSVTNDLTWALWCRELDIEALAGDASSLPGFLSIREHAGLRNGGSYCSLDTWPSVRQVLEAAGIGNDRCRVRIADWTGQPQQFGPDQLGAGWTAWAHQFTNDGGYDRNAAWQPLDFDHVPVIPGVSQRF